MRFNMLDPPEHPWISKVNHLSIVKHEPGAAVRFVLSAGPMNELAGHAQVSKKAAVFFEAQQEILASPSGAHHFAANLPELLAIASAKNPRLLAFLAYPLAPAIPPL